MRILYIHQYFATRDSEHGQIRSYEFARRMLEAGHEVVMVTGNSRLGEDFAKSTFVRRDVDGIDVRSVRVSYSNYMGYWRRLWSFSLFMLGATWLALRSGPIDVVLATSTPLTVGIPGWFVAFLRRRPFVFEVRDLWPEAAIQMGVLSRRSPIALLAKRVERFLYRHAHAVIALSPGMVAGVIAEGTDPAKVHMVPNCADLDLFHPGRRDPALVKRLGLGHKFVVGYTGALSPSTAVEDSVPQAARILLDRGRDDIVFVIAGEGRSLPALERAKRDLGLTNLSLLGSMPKNEVPAMTRTANVLLTLFADVPILATNSPNKFFDGLASGRPMIVNSPGWTRELVEEHDAGVYVPAGDPDALADAIESLADDRATVKRMGANARDLAEMCFSRDEQADTLIRVLESVAGPTSDPATG